MIYKTLMSKPLFNVLAITCAVFCLPLPAFGAHKIEVTKELYIEHPRPGTAAFVIAYYVGPALELIEIHTTMWKSDEPMLPTARYSNDNGTTWSQFKELPTIVTEQQKAVIWWWTRPILYDPGTDKCVSVWLRQTRLKEPAHKYYDHCFCRTSSDYGRSWSEPRQIIYEEGSRFDPNHPLDHDFLRHNSMYFGNNLIRNTNGTLIFAGTSVNIPEDAPDPDPTKSYGTAAKPSDARNIGSALFVGIWNESKNCYDWKSSNRVYLPRFVSRRGLMEAAVVELNDGSILVVWRGEDTDVTAGRKWYSLSKNAGRTLCKIRELRYDDHSRFYSPSSIHDLIRHSQTGALFWIGNICSEPPRGNSPRYPLVIAEVDEAIPALKKDSVTVIDDRGAGDSPRLQLSNFSVIENRRTHNFELYVTRLGADHDNFWQGDCYKYTIAIN